MKIFKVLFEILKKILIIILIIAALLTIVYLWEDNKPMLHNGFQDEIETGGEIEKKYLQNGECEVKKTTVKEEKPIKKYTIYYPKELEKSDKKYPTVFFVNGTGAKATKYEPMFKQLASWGFIVVGTQDKTTGSGETTIKALNYMLSSNKNKDSVFYGKIDIDSIGITGHSQGGAATMNAITKYEESRFFKAAAPISPVSEKTAAQTTHYPYDSSDVKIPIFILAGTSGDFEIEIVIPFDGYQKMYNKITSPKIQARRTEMTHDDMQYKAQGYVTAWFMWQLRGDEEAAKAFIGENPEIMDNRFYQDQRIDFPE